MVLPNAEMPSLPVTLVIVAPETDSLDGAPPLDREADVLPSRLCGMRDGVASSAVRRTPRKRENQWIATWHSEQGGRRQFQAYRCYPVTTWSHDAMAASIRAVNSVWIRWA